MQLFNEMNNDNIYVVILIWFLKICRNKSIVIVTPVCFCMSDRSIVMNSIVVDSAVMDYIMVNSSMMNSCTWDFSIERLKNF